MRPVARLIEGWRAAPAAVFSVAVLILLAGIGIIYQSEINFRQGRVQQALVQAQILAESAAAAVDFNDPIAAQESVDAFEANRQVVWVGVYGRDGRLVAGYDRSGAPAPQAIASIPEDSPGGIRVSAPVVLSGQRIGIVYFEIAREPLSLRLARYALLAMLVLLAALVVVALGMAQATLRQANRKLAERAEALGQANLLLEEQMEERAKAEDQLRQSQKMQALGQLTGGIAHDFNNLLTVIQGSADMLCRQGLPEDKRVRFARAIVQAAESAAALTGQLLAFARRQPLKPERLDVNELIRSMRDLIDRTMGERIQVIVDAESSGCTVEVDRSQLQSAILNIASNARDAMPEGGKLTVATRDSTDSADSPVVEIIVSDSGSGMDAETLGRIFEPFFTTKETGKGTGLGLSQVYGFASQSGGEVRVDSEPGSGTAVTLTLPCCEEGPSERAALGGDVARQASASVLVVEDNEDVGAFAETLFEELGHEVTLVTSGEAALEFARTRDFDLVFSDVVMPGMGGLKLAETLQAEKPNLPIILATGYSQEIAQGGSGNWPVILKPYRLATLSEAVADALNGGVQN